MAESQERGQVVSTWVYDDGGRAFAGFQGCTGDCVCRAIAIATQQPYREVYDTLNQLAKERGIRGREKRLSSARTGVYKPVAKNYLRQLGWEWTPTMGIGTGCQVHLRADELSAGRLVVSLSRHYSAVIDGIIHDLYDPSREGTRCVYGFWRAQKLRPTAP